MSLQKDNSGNNCIVTRLNNVRKHPGADRLKLATVLGTQVIVGLEAKENDLVLYFDSNLRLSHEYLHYNNLYSNLELNVDTTKKGYFGKNGRVKAQKFRGEFSNGYVAELSSLFMAEHPYIVTTCSYPMYEKLEEGDEFTHINGVKICEKYIVPIKTINSGGRKNKIVGIPMFWKHWDTKQLMRNLEDISDESLCYIEEKIHGSSHRTGRVLCKRPWYKFWKPKKEWKVVSGTRRVDNIDFHMHEERKEIENKVAPHLHKGEQLYMEIYGYTKDGGEIQKGFTYGCKFGEYKAMLYRVTITTPDEFCIDLNRKQVYKRAEELGLEKPYLLDMFFPSYLTEMDDSQEVIRNKTEMMIELAQGKSHLDAGTLLEGIVVWFMDKNGNWTCLKHKSEEFLGKESKNKDNEIGDIEDSL